MNLITICCCWCGKFAINKQSLVAFCEEEEEEEEEEKEEEEKKKNRKFVFYSFAPKMKLYAMVTKPRNFSKFCYHDIIALNARLFGCEYRLLKYFFIFFFCVQK